MKELTLEELSNYKILPFNIFSNDGDLIFSVGEVITSRKLLQIKRYPRVYRDDIQVPDILAQTKVSKPEEKLSENSQLTAPVVIQQDENQVVETFDMNPKQIIKDSTSLEDFSATNYKGPVNKNSQIPPKQQLQIKAYYNELMSSYSEKSPKELISLFSKLRDKLVLDIIYKANNIVFSSELKLIGEYDKCHALNVAILSGTVAKKLELSESKISDIVLGALLHDIGKTKIPRELLTKSSLNSEEERFIAKHTQFGYNIMKQEMNLPNNICLIALEHHEKNDGSGYPMHKSGDSISKESQIVSVCNMFDNLTFNKTPIHVKNTKEALRALMSFGTKQFSAEILYSFLHMFSYNDTTNFEDMVL